MKGFKDGDGCIYCDGNEKFLGHRVFIFIVDEASCESSKNAKTADEGIKCDHIDGNMGKQLRVILKKRQMEDMDTSRGEHGDTEIDGDNHESFFLSHILESFSEIRFVGYHGETLVLICCFTDVFFGVADFRFKYCRHKESDCVERKKGCGRTCLGVDEGGYRHHESGKGIDHTGDGVGF